MSEDGGAESGGGGDEDNGAVVTTLAVGRERIFWRTGLNGVSDGNASSSSESEDRGEEGAGPLTTSSS